MLVVYFSEHNYELMYWSLKAAFILHLANYKGILEVSMFNHLHLYSLLHNCGRAKVQNCISKATIIFQVLIKPVRSRRFAHVLIHRLQASKQSIANSCVGEEILLFFFSQLYHMLICKYIFLNT